MSETDLWRVAVPAPLRRTFTYSVPDSLGRPTSGARVLVPFGRRRVTGFLVEPIAENPKENFEIKQAFEILDERPAIPGDLLKFLVESAAYYMHPLGEVMKAALPPGIDYSERKGVLRSPKFSEKKEKIAAATALAEPALSDLEGRAPARARVLAAICRSSPIPVKELRSVSSSYAAQLRRLEDDGLIRIEQREARPRSFFETAVPKDTPPILTSEQQTALEAMGEALGGDGYRGFLLHGVTGSGKTEVYLHAIQIARDLGRGALVLVPEISLTPQLVTRYRARFGDDLAVMHSGMTDRQRFEQWQLVRQGRVRVAIGVRSAIFAPISDLGIIVVDEEHDGSFKQERGFPYNARDLALLRAARSRATAVLGSATPSLESFQNSRVGKLALLELKQRATRSPLPEVQIIDLKSHRSGPAGQNLISKPLHDALRETLSRRQQAILFLNRRGFAPALLCTSCGEQLACRDCAVSMTLHLRPERLICHYCGATRRVPEQCPSCKTGSLRQVGIGTQKAEQILAELFPDARVARLDRDVGSGRAAEELLESLRAGDIDILIGTQMITKGHDFPRVTLVGVLAADVGLHMPDFRAGERTFQLLTQVAGRAGRADSPGRAFIQTYTPNHPAVLRSAKHDYLGFAEEELLSRGELQYPPFGRMAALRLSSPDENRVEAAARRLCMDLREARARLNLSDVTLLGPAPAPLHFLQGRFRHRIILRSSRSDRLRALLERVMGLIEAPGSGVRVSLDFDPVSML